MTIKEMFIEVVRKAPIISGLPDCHLKDYWAAIKEIVPNIFLSTMPIWGGAFIIMILGESSDYWTAIDRNVNNGELFLYAASFLAPVVYMATVDPPGAEQFPSRLAHIIVLIGIMILSALAFGVQKTGHKLDPIIGFNSSCLLVFASIFLLFIASIYQHKRLPKITEEDVHSNETDFREKYRKHRR